MDHLSALSSFSQLRLAAQETAPTSLSYSSDSSLSESPEEPTNLHRNALQIAAIQRAREVNLGGEEDQKSPTSENHSQLSTVSLNQVLNVVGPSNPSISTPELTPPPVGEQPPAAPQMPSPVIVGIMKRTQKGILNPNISDQPSVTSSESSGLSNTSIPTSPVIKPIALRALRRSATVHQKMNEVNKPKTPESGVLESWISNNVKTPPSPLFIPIKPSETPVSLPEKSVAVLEYNNGRITPLGLEMALPDFKGLPFIDANNIQAAAKTPELPEKEKPVIISLRYPRNKPWKRVFVCPLIPRTPNGTPIPPVKDKKSPESNLFTRKPRPVEPNMEEIDTWGVHYHSLKTHNMVQQVASPAPELSPKKSESPDSDSNDRRSTPLNFAMALPDLENTRTMSGSDMQECRKVLDAEIAARRSAPPAVEPTVVRTYRVVRGFESPMNSESPRTPSPAYAPVRVETPPSGLSEEIRQA